MNKSLVAALLVTALGAGAPAIASAQTYSGYQPGYHNGHGHRVASGQIVNVNKTNITLQGGQQIFLKNGTVINPTGARLQPGQFISVRGTRGGDGAINATIIDVGGNRRY